MSTRQNWKKILASFIEKQKEEKGEKEEKRSKEKLRVEKFYATTVNPAFEELKSEFKKYGREIEHFLSEYKNLSSEHNKEIDFKS